MKYYTKLLGFALATALVSQGVRADDNAPQKLQFNFELNHPLVYSLDSMVRMVTDRSLETDSGNRSVVTTNLVETRLKIKLTPVKKGSDGTWTILYQPSDFENEVRADANNSRMVTSMRGLEVKSTQDGILVVDTSKDMGMAQAKALKQAVYTKMLSGYFDFKPDGEVAAVNGDLPFVDYWNETLKFQMGFFDTTFPADAVAVGGTWSLNRTMKNLQGLKLGAGGIVETNVFTRKGVSSAGGHFETIASRMTVTAKDLTGSMESGGQSSSLDISQFNHEKDGTFEFDTSAGCMTGGNEDEQTKTAMSALMQGHTVTVHLDIHSTTKFELEKE
jgi:hypothetical protein